MSPVRASRSNWDVPPPSSISRPVTSERGASGFSNPGMLGMGMPGMDRRPTAFSAPMAPGGGGRQSGFSDRRRDDDREAGELSPERERRERERERQAVARAERRPSAWDVNPPHMTHSLQVRRAARNHTFHPERKHAVGTPAQQKPHSRMCRQLCTAEATHPNAGVATS